MPKNIKISFTRGEMVNIGGGYYDLKLFNKEGKRVYAATLPTIDAAEMISKHNNILLINQLIG